ncbi:MAG: hypothetical protein RL572_1008 [Pseudomonadota bacterium]|jgi:hypothetical protein
MNLLPQNSLPCLLLLASVLAASVLPAGSAQSPSLAGEWRGTYNINIGGDREIIFTLREVDGVLSGTFDNPTAGIMAVSVDSISVNGNDIRLLLPRIQGEYYGTIRDELGADGLPVRIDGDWSQAGEYIPITLRRSVAP